MENKYNNIDVYLDNERIEQVKENKYVGILWTKIKHSQGMPILITKKLQR